MSCTISTPCKTTRAMGIVLTTIPKTTHHRITATHTMFGGRLQTTWYRKIHPILKTQNSRQIHRQHSGFQTIQLPWVNIKLSVKVKEFMWSYMVLYMVSVAWVTLAVQIQ